MAHVAGPSAAMRRAARRDTDVLHQLVMQSHASSHTAGCAAANGLALRLPCHWLSTRRCQLERQQGGAVCVTV